jgi:aryl-alcohol dehydrogenase-like predicted oxidoreductase
LTPVNSDRTREQSGKNPEIHLALGTAQLGMHYGIGNTTGQPESEQAQRIVTLAWEHGIRYFDTAQVYGDSEMILGRALRDVGVAGEAQVVSKLSPSVETDNPDSILKCIRASLTRLGLEQLWGVMLHREDQLERWSSTVSEAFDCARREGIVAHIGVSVYSPSCALQALEMPGLDVLQVPANLFDRRMRNAEVFAKAAAKGVTVFIRSIYLQGVALFSSQQAKENAPFAISGVTALEQFCRTNGLDQKRFVFEYARDISQEALRIVGAETGEQVAENCWLESEPPLDTVLFRQWDKIWPDDMEELANPSRWPSTTLSKR